MNAESGWREERRVAADERVAALERRKAVETVQARELLAGFVAAARERELPLEPLVARAYSGSATYRTPLQGWYLRRDRSLAVGPEGDFYVLTVPPSLRARFTGVTVPASDPPLQVGAGGRDGDSIALAELLRLRLEAGPDWS